MELILTQEENDASSYLDMDDASLGRYTKYLAKVLEDLKDDADGFHKVTAASAGLLMVSACFDANADKLSLTLTGHSHKGIETGDWKITVEKINARIRS